MSDNQPEHHTSPLTEAQNLVRRLAEPVPAGDSTKAAIGRSARRLSNWSYNRVRDVWHAEPRVRIRAEELEELRRVSAARLGIKGKDHGGDDLQAGLEELRGKITSLEAHLESLTAQGGDGLGVAGLVGGGVL